jgi:hypothetical protein
MESTLIKEGGRGIFFFIRDKFWPLIQPRKNSNVGSKWPCQILAVKGYISWSFLANATAIVVLISLKKPYRGMIKC